VSLKAKKLREYTQFANYYVDCCSIPSWDVHVGPPHKLMLVDQVSFWDLGNVVLVLSIVTFEKRSRLMARLVLTFFSNLRPKSIVMLYYTMLNALHWLNSVLRLPCGLDSTRVRTHVGVTHEWMRECPKCDRLIGRNSYHMVIG
jgi:hypothetical protein